MKSGFKSILAAVFCLVFLAPAQSGWAQEEKQQEQKTRRTEALSEKVHRRLSKAQEALEVNDYATAEKLLREITELRNLSPYERAQTNNFYGFMYHEKEDYPAAIEAFRRVLQTGGPDVIGPGLHNGTIRTLAQLYMQVENYSEAVIFSRRWIDSQENPQPKDYMLLGMAHFLLEEWQQSLDNTRIAIEKAQATGMEVEENWWRYVLAAHWELEQYPQTLEVSKILLTHWPKKQFWMQLQGLYSIVDDESNKLAAFWSCYDQGLLDKNNEMVTMAQLFMLAENPYRAAVVLEEGLDNNVIEESATNYRLLAQAWQLAREDRKALAPLRKAAESEEDMEDRGDLYARLAETYNALNEYDECVSAARQALGEGELKSEGRTYLLLGQCLLELDKFDEARSAFGDAARDPDSRKRATQWTKHLDSEVKQLRYIEAQMAQFGP